MKAIEKTSNMNKLTTTPLASKGSAKASYLDTATAKAELGVNGC